MDPLEHPFPYFALIERASAWNWPHELPAFAPLVVTSGGARAVPLFTSHLLADIFLTVNAPQHEIRELSASSLVATVLRAADSRGATLVLFDPTAGSVVGPTVGIRDAIRAFSE